MKGFARCSIPLTFLDIGLFQISPEKHYILITSATTAQGWLPGSNTFALADIRVARVPHFAVWPPQPGHRGTRSSGYALLPSTGSVVSCGGTHPRNARQSASRPSNLLNLSFSISVNVHRPSITRSRIACPEAGDSPNPTLDMVATTTLEGSDRRSKTGRPSGVFSTIPDQLRMTLSRSAPGMSSASRRAMLRLNGLVGRLHQTSSDSSHSCGPPPKADRK